MTCANLSFIAKPIGHLPLRVFERYTSQVVDAFSTSPVQLANELHSNGLLSRELKDRVVEVRWQTLMEKASILVSGLGAVIASAEGSAKPLRKAISVMRAHAHMKRLADKMTKRLG